MIMQIIFMVGMYPLVLVLYFVMRGVGDAKNGYAFGAAMKQEWMKDEGVQQVVAQYRRELKREVLVLSVIPLVTFFIPYFSITFSIWTLWMFAVIIVPGISYVRGNGNIRRLKQGRGWQKNGQKIFAEMKHIGEVRRVKFLTFLPPIVLCGLAAVYAVWWFYGRGLGGVSFVVVTFAVMTPCFYLAAVAMDRQKNEVVSSDTAINLNYTRARKHIWKNFWVTAAWVNTAYTVLVAVTMRMDIMHMEGILWGCIVYSLILVGLMVFAWKKIQEIDGKYRTTGELQQEEDDTGWIGGIIYYNKNDTHSMVNIRAGIGTTMNMAKPIGKVMGAIGIITLLSIPIMCLWLVLEEFTPIRVSLQEDVLVTEHLKEDYRIPVLNIREVALIDELPTWSKVNGTGMDNLCKGTFYIRNVGKCEVLVNPQNDIFMQIQTADDTYYISAASDSKTQEIYEKIVDAVQQ